MIVRTYQRRSRTGRSLSDGGLGDSSQSQDSPWSSQEAFPSSFPSSQESCWWQPENGYVAILPTRSTANQSNGGSSQEDNMVTELARPRPPLWSSRQMDNEGLQGTITSLQSLDSHNRSSQEIEGSGFMEKLVLNGDFTASRSFKNTVWGPTTPTTASLLEAQESGEMMEQMDEANFALDGLKHGQPLRIQRASLQSILALCGSMQRRRLLRTHGLVKPFLDAVVALPTDDPPLALAAAAVLYFLALDGQNEELFDSVGCVQFLMRLLGSSLPQPAKKIPTTVGNKLAGLGAKLKISSVSTGGLDQGGAAVVAEVHQLFAKEEKSPFGHLKQDDESGYLLGQEVTSKWLALLTLEKACISTVVLEDNSGSVRKVDGCFKERLRELGGLDTVCDLAAGCLRNIREALEAEETEKDNKNRDFQALEKCEKNGGVGMLLRCLRVMENVTFLSEQNQRHLLELRLPRVSKGAPHSFIALVVSTIKILSDLADCHKERSEVLGRRNNEFRSSDAGTGSSLTMAKSSSSGFKGVDNHSRIHVKKPGSAGELTHQRKKLVMLSSMPDLPSVGKEVSKRSPGKALLRLKSEVNAIQSSSSTAEVSSTANLLLKQKSAPPNSLLSRRLLSISGTSCCDTQEAKPSSRTSVLKRKESVEMEDSQDPFAFDDIDLDFVSGQASKKKGRKTGKAVHAEEASDAARASGLRGEITVSNSVDSLIEASLSTEECEEPSPHQAVHADCLVSAVKVLMNLTNNNPVGCRQVAMCGGLDTIASLLVAHFPNPQSSPPLVSPGKQKKQRPGGPQHGSSERLKEKGGQADQDLDMVVVALGVLCNLVEKDEGNRARLATLEVALPPHIAAKEGSVRCDSGMIALLCALFLSKQGAGEAAEAIEEKMQMELDDDANFKQGEREAEDMIVEAYAALLLAFLSRESDRARFAIAQLLPGDDLTGLVPVLERFVAFHLSLNMLSAETHAAVTEVINSCRDPLPVRPMLT